MHSIPVHMVTNYWQLNGLIQHIFYLPVLLVRRLFSQKTKIQVLARLCFFILLGRIHYLHFPTWFTVSSLIFKAGSITSSNLSPSDPAFSLPSYKDVWNFFQPIRIIQDNLVISKSLMWSHLRVYVIYHVN